MTTKQLLTWLIIFLVGLCSGLYLDNCRNKAPVTTTTIVPGDSVPTTTTLPAPDPVYIDTGSTHWFGYPVYRDTGKARWLYHPIDTNELIKAYFSRLIYKRTLKDDSSAFIYLIDTITQNKLGQSTLVFKNRRAQVIQNIYGEIPVSQTPIGLYAGFAVGRSSRQFGLGPSVMLLRKNCAYSVVYDAINKDLYLTVSKPIWKPRKVP